MNLRNQKTKIWSMLVGMIIITLTVLLVGCAKAKNNQLPEAPQQVPATENHTRIGVVLTNKNVRDQLLSQSIQAALQKAGENLEVEANILKQGELSTDREAMDYLANNGYQYIIGIGTGQKKALEQVAKDYPDLRFILIDEVSQLPNVSSVIFREDDAAFLAGNLAALLTKTNIVSYLGGADEPPNLKEKAFKAGVSYINKTENRTIPVEVKVEYAGYFAKAFQNPEKGNAMAIKHIDNGSDLIYHTAGHTGDGILAGAAARGVKVIGSGFNQNMLQPGIVITSTVLTPEQGIYQLVQNIAANKVKPGINYLGLKEKAVGLVDLKVLTPEETKALENNQAGLEVIRKMKDNIPQEIVNKLNTIKGQLEAGKLNVMGS